MRNQPWSTEEVQGAVQEYFEMMKAQKRGMAVNKAEIYRGLSKRFPERSPKAFELKFTNISAVLEDLGMEYAEGLRPMAHYQDLLRTEVLKWIKANGA